MIVMSQRFGFGAGDSGDPEAFRDAPLFRELQRVMASSTGPVNWELARQVGVATAVEAGDDADPTDIDRHGFEEAVRVAELHVARFTGLEPPGDVARVRAVRRAEWVDASTESLRSMLEPAARRLTSAMELAARDQMPPEMQSMAGLMGQLSPLLMGTQIGQVLGFLAQRVLGQYDVAVPRSGPGEVVFVAPNVAAFEKDWSLDATDFRTSVALHEVTHRFEFARPWVRDHFLSLVRDLVEHAELDLSGLEQRLEGLDLGSPEALQEAFEGMGNFLGQTSDPEQRLRIARVQAFMAIAEGYGDHVMEALGRRMLSTYPQIEEALRRYREDRHGDQALERLLGLEMKREQYRLGGQFCAKVAELTDEATLARVWESPEALPSMPELEEPTLWLARMA